MLFHNMYSLVHDGREVRAVRRGTTNRRLIVSYGYGSPLQALTIPLSQGTIPWWSRPTPHGLPLLGHEFSPPDGRGAPAARR